MLAVFPLAVPFWRCSRRSVIAVTSSGFGSDHGGLRWGSTISNATTSRRVGMMFIWSLITVAARRAGAILNDWPHFWWWASWATVRRKRTWTLRGTLARRTR